MHGLTHSLYHPQGTSAETVLRDCLLTFPEYLLLAHILKGTCLLCRIWGGKSYRPLHHPPLHTLSSACFTWKKRNCYQNLTSPVPVQYAQHKRFSTLYRGLGVFVDPVFPSPLLILRQQFCDFTSYCMVSSFALTNLRPNQHLSNLALRVFIIHNWKIHPRSLYRESSENLERPTIFQQNTFCPTQHA